MDIRVLDDGMAVADQISLDDIPVIRAAGYSILLCNRPDDEEPNQPRFGDIAEAAAKAGIAARHIPLSRGAPTPDLVLSFVNALNDAERESRGVLAYCRSGTRSCMLWGLAEARRGRGADDIISRAASRGYDLGFMRGVLK